jgi:hypothetical protein
MAGQNTKNPFDKDFTLTTEYCRDECYYWPCCILYIAMEREAIKSASFDQEDKDWGCAYIQELRWIKEKEEEEKIKIT